MIRFPAKRLALALRSVLVAAALLLAAFPVAAEEVILSYHSVIELAKSGDLTVTENIKINAEGNQIRHGIYRDIPLTFTDENGAVKHAGFSLVSVTRDGAAEPYTTESFDQGIRIKIGSGDVTVEPGVHDYAITFVTDRQIRSFKDYDELMWNVTGNGWAFPIEEATATVMLPKGVSAEDTAFFTGPYGSKDQNARMLQEAGDVFFGTTRPLKQKEGLTFSIKLAKGAIDPPSDAQKSKWFFEDNRNSIIAGGGFLLVLGYYLWGWNKVGRDPPRGVMVPRWDAPEGISPALVNYIDNKGFGSNAWTALSASALNLAVKGMVTLEDLDKGLTMTRTDKPAPAKLPDGEGAIMAVLGAAGSKFLIAKSNGSRVESLGDSFKSSIEKEHRGEFYRDNAGYIAFGVLLTILSAAALIFFGSLTPDAIFTLVISAVVAVMVSVFAVFAGHTLFSRGSMLKKVLGIVALAFFGLVVLSMLGGLFAMVLVTLERDGQVIMLGSVAGIIISNILFFYLMGAPTPLGTRMMDGIDGLRQYMTLAEANRMNLAGAPTMSPQHFETLLPYAVALGVEKPWSNLFQTWLASAAAGAVAANYAPAWYYGGGHGYSHFGDRISDFSSSMADSFAASMPDPPPSSSSSSFSGGGGGFSGGGGGGGGGGGW